MNFGCAAKSDVRGFSSLAAFHQQSYELELIGHIWTRGRVVRLKITAASTGEILI